MAYTKYSLTPANNTATPPDGAPEGMLPSAVNDTMRDMMAQIRDCGDGIRDGTYTMTAAKITGGTITGVTLTGNTFSNPTITGVSTFSAGTVSAPAITTSGDTNTGIFFPAADTIAFTEGGVESMRIDSSGNVGIGVSPSAWSTTVPALQLGGGGAFLAALGSSPYVALGTNAHYNGTNFVYRTTNTASYYDQSSGLHRWYTAPSGTAGTNVTFTQAMTLDASGNVLVGITSARANAGDVQVSKGISFPATQSAQSDANTLDDYEEGTFTPTVSGSSTAGTGTYGTQIGRYTKIGNQVTVCGYISWTAHTGTGDIRFTNLPFTALNVSGYYSSASFYVSNISLTANNVMTASYLPFNQNYVLAAQTPVGGGAASLVPMDTAGEVIYTVTYFV